MKTYKVSVIIPVYNAEDTIGNILQKLITQKYKNIEVIVINDGSTDDSLSVIKSYAKQDKRINVIDQPNAGASAARNTGIKKASGVYITFIDADDDIDTNLISELVKSNQDEHDLIVCGMILNNKKITPKEAIIQGEHNIKKYVLRSLLTKNLLYGPCCKLFRRDLIASYNLIFPEDIKYGEDTIFVLSYLSKTTSMQLIDAPLYVYRISNNGLSSTNIFVPEYRNARLTALNKFVKNIQDLPELVTYILLRIRWGAARLKAKLRVML